MMARSSLPLRRRIAALAPSMACVLPLMAVTVAACSGASGPALIAGAGNDAGSPGSGSDGATAPSPGMDAGTSVPPDDAAATPPSDAQGVVPPGSGIDGGDSGSDAQAMTNPGDSGSSTVDPCKGPGILLCDDFEAATLDTATWTKVLQGNDPHSTVTIDANMARTGKRSLHSTISGNAGQAMIAETKTFPIAMNTMYGRAYFYFGAPVIQSHTSFLVAQGAHSAYRLGEQYGTWFMNVVSDSAAEQVVGTRNTDVATGAWQCLQWKFDGTAGSFNEAIDGVALDATGSDPTMYGVDGFSSIRFGMEAYDSGSASTVYDMWIDDVAIGTQVIPCLPAPTP